MLTETAGLGYAIRVLSLAAAYAGKRVLITGGLGFIGSNLAIALAEVDVEICLLDAMLPEYGATPFNIEPIRHRVRVNVSDLRDSVGLRHLVAGQDVVFNLAGQASHLRSMTDPIGDLEINCRAQLSLLECCRRYAPRARMVLASTRQVYGRPRHLPVDESHSTEAVDINGVHKLASEGYYRLYHRVHGLETVVLRLTNTYGPRMDLISGDKGVLGVFIRRALLGERIQLFGGGMQKRDCNYVDDVVAALLSCGVDQRVIGGTFNLGHEQPIRLLDFVHELRRLTGCEYEHRPFPVDQEAIDIGDYYASFSKLTEATGWRPKVDLPDGLARTIDYFRRYREIYLSGGATDDHAD